MRRLTLKYAKISLVVFAAAFWAQAACAETFVINAEQSKAAFIIKHEIGFNSAFIQGLSGNFEIDDKSGAVKKLEAQFDIDSLTSFNEKRDRLLKSEEFFNTGKFPNASLKFKKIDGKILKADVTIRGVTKPVDFEYFYFGKSQDEAGKSATLIRLSATLKRNDFGLSYNVTAQDGTSLLGEDVDVLLDLRGVVP